MSSEPSFNHSPSLAALQHPDAQDLRLVYTAFARSDADAMPLGNGIFAANLSFHSPGYIEFPIARADAWDEHHRLIKLDKVRIHFAEGLSPEDWSQRLDPFTGTVTFSGKTASDNPVQGKIWIDRFHPTLVLDIDTPGAIKVSRQRWRREERAFQRGENHFVELYETLPNMLADEDVATDEGLTWYHHNLISPFADNLRLQHLTEAAARCGVQDPLLNRISGATIWGENLQRNEDGTATSRGSLHRIRITTHVAHPTTPDEWLKALRALRDEFAGFDLAERFHQHSQWWLGKFNQSWLVVRGSEEARAFTLAYLYQRYLLLCAGTGPFPIKFNGSLFTFDPHPEGSHFAKENVTSFSPDFRMWGGCYWFQNTRLAYWALLACGDNEMFEPFFRLHTGNLEFARARTRVHHGHDGIYFPETTTLWGTYTTSCYGKNREERGPLDPPDNEWIRHHYNCTLEMLFLMLQWDAQVGDPEAWERMVLPYAREVLTWWEQHWTRDPSGKLSISPAHSCESYWNVTNPAPDVAGLTACLDTLLGAPLRLPEDVRTSWEAFRAILPPLPGEGTRLLPCAPPVPEPRNVENPECYSIFPYRLNGLGHGDLARARETFSTRRHTDRFGWQQNGIFAALVGDTAEALADLRARIGRRYRDSWFPAFWAANYDWAPDQDHGCCLMLTLQSMVLQVWGNTVLEFPACPADWTVDFKLTTPRGTIRNTLTPRSKVS